MNMFYDTLSLKESIHHKLQKINNEGGRHAFSLVSTFLKVFFEEWNKVENKFQHAKKVCL
jgi:hypothetical protein